jgi:uncharacterized protein with HEPN domain
MKTTKDKKDTVKKMRSIRDKLSHEIMDMSYNEQKDYIKKQLAELKSKKHGRQSSRRLTD